MRPKISVIIPAYNEAKTIKSLKVAVIKALRQFGENGSTEIIIVDDGSRDLTYQYANTNGTTVIRHEKNMGYGAAVKSGLERARGDIVITIDGDYQNEPYEIPNLIKELIRTKADFVNGSKFLKPTQLERVPFLKQIGEKIAHFIIRLVYRKRITYSQSGFKAMKKSVYDKVKPLKEDKFGFNSELLIKSLNKGFNVRELPVTIKPRPHGKSRIAFFKDGFRILFVMFKNILLRR